MSEDPTRPVSVAELLARNGTIGSPPVSGHRRRKRRNAVSVAELTGELPVIRTGEIPMVVEDESGDFDEPQGFDDAGVEVVSETVVYSSADVSYADVDDTSATAVPDSSASKDFSPGYDETPGYAGILQDEERPTYVETTTYVATDTVSYADTPSYDYSTSEVESAPVESGPLPEVALPAEAALVSPPVAGEIAVRDEVVAERLTEPRAKAGRPPLSSIPLPRRRRGPERSHDPRPRRRSTGPEPARPAPRASGAEQMSPDPVDEAVDLSELVAEQGPDPAELRSYLKSSTATLFFGETVADDLARRGEVVTSGSDDYEADDDDRQSDDGADESDDAADDGVDTPRRGALSVLGTSLVAVVQSLVAVVFGAGLFIGFDQLWRWNNIVALALSALVIAALMIGVHVVRKTEDFVSILIAALVGILVTFGPLALQST